MIHWPGLAPERPIKTPILLSAMGPKGHGDHEGNLRRHHHRVSDTPVEMDWHVQMFNGTVLDDGEAPDSERVKEAVGPWAIMPYHGGFSFAPEIADMLPNGTAWRDRSKRRGQRGSGTLPSTKGTSRTSRRATRELVIDAVWDTPMRMGGWVHTPDDVRANAERAGANGVTELLYTPSGPDVLGEIRRMAEALNG